MPKPKDLACPDRKRLLETLDSVLTLAKLEADEMQLSISPVDLQAEAAAVEQFAPQAKESGIDLSVDAPGASVRAEADENGVRIALHNVLSNALKYTDEGSVTVEVSSDERSAVLAVTDTGIGMDSAQVPELMEAFKQASEGFDRTYEGAGLGLTVTNKVVEQMGGELIVETEEGEGSRFAMRFPTA